MRMKMLTLDEVARKFHRNAQKPGVVIAREADYVSCMAGTDPITSYRLHSFEEVRRAYKAKAIQLAHASYYDVSLKAERSQVPFIILFFGD